MKPREEQKHEPKEPRVRRQAPKPRLRIVKLEGRITPGFALNHNETLVREPAKGKPKDAEVRKAGRKPRLRIVKLEGRITPGYSLNHNETLVCDRA